MFKVPGERSGVFQTQAGVEIQRIFPQRGQQPLREIDLKHVPGINVFNGPPHTREVVFTRKIAGDSRMIGKRKLRGQIGKWQVGLT